MFITTRGLVLREVKYKEADKILTILTEDEGKITVRARGALRKGCRYSAATQLLTFSEMTLFHNHGRWSLNEGSTVEQFLGIRNDLTGFALGTYFAELLEAVSDEDEPNPTLLSLGLNALFALSRKLYPPEHIKAVFELRLACLAGFAPALDGCSVCGITAPEHPWFSTDGGVLCCSECRPTVGAGLPLCAASLAAMVHVTHAAPKKIFSFTLDEAGAARFHAVSEAYILSQLDRGFGGLDYWKRVR
ncbi:MAG: DNA repair protein RecO [Eubacteriales bacterium]|nr:DNA repair protein RecO [Eubacteriales bacterium]